MPKHPDNIDPTHEDLAHDPVEDLKTLAENGYGWQKRLAETWLKRAARAERMNRCRSVLLRRFLAWWQDDEPEDSMNDLLLPREEANQLADEIRRHLRDDGAM